MVLNYSFYSKDKLWIYYLDKMILYLTWKAFFRNYYGGFVLRI